MNADDVVTVIISTGCFMIGIAMLIMHTELVVLSPFLGIMGFVAVCLGITIGEG